MEMWFVHPFPVLPCLVKTLFNTLETVVHGKQPAQPYPYITPASIHLIHLALSTLMWFYAYNDKHCGAAERAETNEKF